MTACPGAGYANLPEHLKVDGFLAKVQELVRKLKRAKQGSDASVSTADGPAIKAQLIQARTALSQAKGALKLFNPH